ncbi:hypothetical protein [Tuberibacillus sp. Marseille-P3662]|uniref:hypothetical protein n=1 Tax=Tuberibacillus sp. Marseille-P3662 TaxID=1965358 RepID=UPI00111BF80F|nr:hypothetical protein [Tuberibacillus sp. Marseille-P3662]
MTTIYIMINILVAYILTIILNKNGFALTPYTNGIYVGITGVITVVYLILNAKKIHLRFSKYELIIFLLLLFLFIEGLVIGIINGNPLIYVISDSLYLLLIILIMITIKISCYLSPFSMEKFSPLTCIIFYIFIIASSILSLNITSIKLLSVVLLIISLKKNNNMLMLTNIIGIIAVSVFSNRTFLLTLIICLVIYYISLVLTKRIPLKAIYFIPIIFVLAFTLYQNPTFQNTPLGKRVDKVVDVFSNENQGIRNDISISNRLFESKLVLNNLNENQIFWITGTGSGSVLNMSLSNDTSVKHSALLGASEVHNIHLLPMALLYRYGIIGVILLAQIIIIIIIRLKYSLPLCLSVICILLFSFMASNYFFSEPLLWISLSLIFNKEIMKSSTG